MCRITGFWDFNGSQNYDIEKCGISMANTMVYGGPDDSGIFIEKEKGLTLVHRRLSIIDLSDLGHQPMCDENEEIWISYNGEVYNYKEIKIELQNKGHRFKSDCDTEVIISAYREWGLDCVEKFRGMWAFAIWDKTKEELILCRDRVGVKPLYWYFKDGLFMFGSELKAFLKHPKFKKEIDKASLSTFLKFGYINSPNSIYKNVSKLHPGSFLIINKMAQIRQHNYWDAKKLFMSNLEQTNLLNQKSENEIIEELEDILKESFKLRLVSDVPVGLFLSGGVDSSLVAALLSQGTTTHLKTFTIGFDDQKYNEAKWAKKVANFLGTYHTELYCTSKDVISTITRLPEIYDEPFGDSSAIPTFLVSNLTKKHVKVSLSADGADELFYGYPTNLNYINEYQYYSKLKWLMPFISPLKNICIKSKKLYNALGADFHRYKLFAKERFHDYELNVVNEIPRLSGSFNNYLDYAFLLDYSYYLPDDILTKVDRATMAVALEGREPFLDQNIIEYSFKLPLKYKFNNGVMKYILKQILYKHIPKELVDRPKQGFMVPIHDMLKNDLKGILTYYIQKNNEILNEVLNVSVEEEYDAFLNRQNYNPDRIWHIFVFLQWYDYYF